jgi:hypothetical protein
VLLLALFFWILINMKLKSFPLHRALLLACLGGTGMAHAAILGGTSGVSDRSELVLVVWDSVAKVSYTKDLGLSLLAYHPGDKITDNFFVNAQQDAGYQNFFAPLNSDANFAEFLKASTSSTNQKWGVYSTGRGDDGFVAGGNRIYTTLNSDIWNGVGVNPEWEKLTTAVTGGLLKDTSGQWATWMTGLNLGLNSADSAGNPFNTHYTAGATQDTFNYAVHGSSYDLDPGVSYFGNAAGLAGGYLANDKVLTTNKIGSSSWFYYLTQNGDADEKPVLVDEFDNLKHDAYWGLAKDASGNYILSFTMEGVMTSTSTANGFMRRNLTDYAAQYGMARQLSAPAGEFLGWSAAVTAVPEPATYGLFSLGLGALGLLNRRRQVKQG